MIPYIITWGLLAFPAFTSKKNWSKTTLYTLLFFLVIFIGLRIEVGGDWYNYVVDIEQYKNRPFLAEVITEPEPFYSVLAWIGSNWGGGIYVFNIVSSIIFSIGLLRFCRIQPRPWLSLLLAFPYLIIIVGMGYTRQSVAIGLEMLALLALQRKKLPEYIGWILVGSTFHRSILILLLLPVTTISPTLKFFNLIRTGLITGGAYGLYVGFIRPALSVSLVYYAADQMTSSGAWTRVILCVLPAIALLLVRSRFNLDRIENRIWTCFALLALGSALGLALGLPTTMIDRLALYLIPLQIFVGSRLPETRLFALKPVAWKQILILLSFSVMMVWLLFALHAYAWLPYRNLLLPL